MLKRNSTDISETDILRTMPKNVNIHPSITQGSRTFNYNGRIVNPYFKHFDSKRRQKKDR